MAANSAPKRVKRSVAVLIRRGGRLLTLRRPDDDDELPGVWGLPAGRYRGLESVDELVRRIGREKLGAKLNPVGRLASGRQERPAYVLEMDVIEARMHDGPRRGEWKWDTATVLDAGRDRGSLCCQLVLSLEEI